MDWKGKKRVKWTKKMLHDLKTCKKEAMSKDKKYMNQMFRLWKEKYPDSQLTVKNLRARLYHLERKTKTPPIQKKEERKEVGRIRWTKEMLEVLQKCGVKALQDKRSSGIPFQRTLKALWEQNYPNSTISISNLASRLYVLRSQNELTTEKENVESSSTDMTFEGDTIRSAYKMMMSHSSHCKHKVFEFTCFNCGMLLYGSFGEGHKYKSGKTTSEIAPLFSLYKKDHLALQCSDQGMYVSCRLCTQNQKQLYFCGNQSTGLQDIPKEIAVLNAYECLQLSLVGIFSTTLKKADPTRRIWQHICGQVNLLRKTDRHYFGMYGFLVSDHPVYKDMTPDSYEKIKKALVLLRKINPLYHDLFCKFETLYRFQNGSVLPDGSNCTTNKDTLLQHELGNEDVGIALPFDDKRETPFIEPDCDLAGIQHPKLTKSQDTQIAEKTHYSDPHLEAKAWPNLFPYGNGSWAPHSELSQLEYVKLRLLNIDPRWRMENNFAFFWYDRMIKARLFYYNRARRVRKSVLVKVKDLQYNNESNDNPYARYGVQVPITIQGSKAYWSARLLDLLAMSNALGQPDLFITLTQNDNWIELQTIKQHGIGECSMFESPESAYRLDATPLPCTELSTEVVIAFMKRFQLFRSKVLADKDGPLGNVVDYWWRAEYQKRGAVHIHLVVWCEKGTVPASVVSAEKPRGDHSLIPISRQLVEKYQMHGECNVNRCFKGPGGTFLTKCKYGFPFKIEATEGLDATGIRMKYVRRNAEDSMVVPYNLPLLFLWGGHINVQRVSSGGWKLYLGKYISKAESTFDLKIPDDATQCEKYLRTRIVGILEVKMNLLGCPISRGSRDVIYLPTELDSKFGFLKRQEHLPADKESSDVFYGTLLDKYMDRPECLNDLLYPEYFERYRICATKEPNCRESESLLRDKLGRIVVKRHVRAITRWRFHLPNRDEKEQFYEQKLRLSIPFDRNTAVISQSNHSKTFMEECGIRGLIDKETEAMGSLNEANDRGFSLSHIKIIADALRNSNFISAQKVDTFLGEIAQARPDVNSATHEVVDDTTELEEGHLGDLVSKNNFENVTVLKDQMTRSQLCVYENIRSHIEAK